jgi:hypothetical protein
MISNLKNAASDTAEDGVSCAFVGENIRQSRTLAAPMKTQSVRDI